MEAKGEFRIYEFVILFFIIGIISSLVSAISSSNYQIDAWEVSEGGGGNTSSSNYHSDVVVGSVSGNISSSNYQGSLGFFYLSSASNTPPNVTSISLVPETGANAYKTTDLNCTFTLSDPDNGDNLGVNYTFYKNNVSQVTGTQSGITNGTSTVIQLMKTNLTKGDSWKCSILPFDDSTNSTIRNSSELVILNSPPSANLLLPNDGNVSTNRYPNFTWEWEDADNDTITYIFNLSCYPGCSADNRYFTGINTDNYSTTGYLKYLSDENYYYNWSVRPYDGEEYGSWSAVRKLEVQSLIDMSLINDSVLFGELTLNEKKNTTAPDLNPLIIENKGNVFLNISLNASSIWQQAPSPNESYQYKIDNSSDEPGGFLWGESDTSWTNMPSITGRAIAYLNWSDSKDEAEVDILLKVPSDEPAGVKTSTVIFEASYADEHGV